MALISLLNVNCELTVVHRKCIDYVVTPLLLLLILKINSKLKLKFLNVCQCSEILRSWS